MNNIKYSNTILINILIASVIPFLILGPFVPDLIVSVSALFFLYFVFKNKHFYYFNNRALKFFFSFCLYCIFVSIFVADDIFFSLKSSLFYFRIGVFSCLIWYLIDKDKNILNYFYYTLIFSFSVLIIDVYIDYLFLGRSLVDRTSSLFGEELIMGSYLSRLFPLLFALFLIKEKKNKFEFYFIGLLFVLVDVLIYLSGERTAFFYLNLSSILIIILINKYQIFRLVTFIIAIIFITIISLYSPNLSERMFVKTAKDMGIVEDSSKEKDPAKDSIKDVDLGKDSTKFVIFTSAHDSHLRTAFNMFKDKPILGHGPKMFRVKCSDPKYLTGDSACSNHPHHFYVQLLAETGIIGFSFLLITLFYVFYCILRQLKSIFLKQNRFLSDYQVCLLAGMLITVWPFSPNGNFFNNWLMITYSLQIGFYLQSIHSKN